MTNRLLEIEAVGQSIWIDNLNRQLLDGGTLRALIDRDGISGVTSNPTIFEKGMGHSDRYDDAFREAAQETQDPQGIFERLAYGDVWDAADLLRPTFEATEGQDGYVSFELPASLADDAEGSIVVEGICAFPVLIETVADKEKLLTFPDGTMLITGTLKVRVTNLDDPANSRLLNISGPGKITPTPDGGEIVEARGTWLWVFAPDELGPGAPGEIILTTGQARAVFEADGSVSFTVLSGRRIDVCALLA